MTGSDSIPQPDRAPDPGPERSPASRRAFIAGAGAATVAGAAVVAVGTAGTAAAATVTTPRATTSGAQAPAAGHGGPAVVAYVRDVASGEIRLMSGEREVVVRDHALARTLARHFDGQEG